MTYTFYMGSMVAIKVQDNNAGQIAVTLQHATGSCHAAEESEARRFFESKLMEAFPASDGWGYHSTICTPLSNEDRLIITQENTKQ